MRFIQADGVNLKMTLLNEIESRRWKNPMNGTKIPCPIMKVRSASDVVGYQRVHIALALCSAPSADM